MAMPTAIVGSVYDRLRRIKSLAQEIEDVPNLAPDVWTMQKIDKKCQEIRQHADWINEQVQKYIGTGAG
jgi:hypothetical protein